MLSLSKNLKPNPGVFLFSAIGCANPMAPPGGWIRRTSDTLQGGCDHDDTVTWKITCSNGAWSGMIGNCTGGKF